MNYDDIQYDEQLPEIQAIEKQHRDYVVRVLSIFVVARNDILTTYKNSMSLNPEPKTINRLTILKNEKLSTVEDCVRVFGLQFNDDQGYFIDAYRELIEFDQWKQVEDEKRRIRLKNKENPF